MKFLLFDIDGTMIDSGGAGMRSMDLAFEELFSIRNAFSDIEMAGKTDLQIISECLSTHGIEKRNGEVPAFFEAYIRYLEMNMDPVRGHVKSGIREVLDELVSRGEHIVGLLTGNIERGAFIKLGFFGLDKYFRIGAFGDEHADRNMLLPLALRKLNGRNPGIDFEDCVIIGDTPRDIDCAKAYNACAVAVATGPYSTETLSAAGADFIFEDLSDTREVLGVLSNGIRKTL